LAASGLTGWPVFISSEGFRQYRLPVRFDELVSVNDRFHIKPLIPLLHDAGRFYVLTINQKNIRVFQGTRVGLQEIEVKDVPKSIDESLVEDFPDNSQLQFKHVRARSTWAGSAAGRSGLFPGHGEDEPDKAQYVARLFRQVDKGLHELLREENAPLVLAGVEYLHPIYREVNTYPHLLEPGIPLSVQGESLNELHQQAWAVVEPQFQRARQGAFDRYLELAATQRASHNMKDIVPAAYHGRVDTLFVALDHQRWGSFDPSAGAVDVHLERRPGDVDLLDLAAAKTIVNGGAVYASEVEKMPDKVLLAAVYRY
jgi:hypothetical protein